MKMHHLRTAHRMCGPLTLLAVLVLVAAQSAVGATVTWHTGSQDSTPAGTGDVPVYLDATTAPPLVFKIIAGDVFHVIAATYTEPEVDEVVVEAILNLSGVDWIGYSILLQGADFFGQGSQGAAAPLVDPVVEDGVLGDAWLDFSVVEGSIGLGSSSIVRERENTLLHINFTDPVSHGEAFALSFEVGDVGEPGYGDLGPNAFLLSQGPDVIPEPFTFVTLGLALVPLYRTVRRRVKA